MVETEPRWLLWQCTPSTELRGSKKNEAHCLLWWVRRSAKPLRKGLKGPKMQFKCTACGNRPRKSEEALWVYENKQDALIEMDRRNRRHHLYRSNSTEVIQ